MTMDTFIFGLLHQAHQVAREAFDDGNLTPTQYLVLRAISEKGDGVNQTRLVACTGIDRSTMADVLRRLEREGLISRSVSPRDTRANAISLTDSGKKALHRASEAAQRANDLILGVIPEGQRRAFLTNLERIGRGPVQVVKEAA